MAQRKRLTEKSIKNVTKNKQKVPDFSGKYHGKLNDKVCRKGAVK